MDIVIAIVIGIPICIIFVFIYSAGIGQLTKAMMGDKDDSTQVKSADVVLGFIILLVIMVMINACNP